MHDECSADVLRLSHCAPEQFGESLCQTGCISFSGIYIFIRDVIAYFHFAILMWDAMMIIMEPKDKVYIFFDFWNQALLFITAEIGMYSAIERWSEHDLDDNCCWDYMRWHSRLFWALYSAVLPSTMLSAIVFWKYRYDGMPLIGTLAEGMGAAILSESVRLVGSFMATLTPAVMLFDFALVAFPLRLLHVFYFIVWYCFYVGMTALMQAKKITRVGRTIPVYYIMNWSKPQKAILAAAVGLIIGVGFYVLFWGLSRLKNVCRHPCPFQ